MAKKQTPKNKQDKIIKNYRNPMESLWAKILIWLLIIGMVGGVIAGLIVALINL